MKVVHVCVTGIWGEEYAYQENLLPHYHRLSGNEVTIIAATYSKYSDGKPKESPVGTSYLKDGCKLMRLAPAISNYSINGHLHLVKGLKKAIIHERPDLLFVHDVSCFNFACLPYIKRRFPMMRVVFDNHSDLVNSLHSPITKFLHKIIYRYFLVPKLIPIAEIFYGVTPSRCEFLNTIYHIPKGNIKLLVMGADDEKMNLDQRSSIRKEVRTKYGFSDSDFVIVSGGKIDLLKNFHNLANAVNQLKITTMKLLLFGSILPNAKEKIESELSDRVQYIGWIQSDKVYDLFYAADLIVFSGLHSVLWEQAVASGTPCAFSKISGFDHVLFDNNCILMEDNTSEYYQQMLNRLSFDSKLYQSLKEHCSSTKVEQFYYSRIAKQVFIDAGLEN